MHEVRLSHPDKVLVPADGITKADLAAHYELVAPFLLPHVSDRPLSLQVYPGGIGGPGHFMKQIPTYFPAWVKRVELPKKGGTVTHVVADRPETLRLLAQHNAITPHVPTARLDRPERPDRLIIDLDPPDESRWDVIVRAALLLGNLYREAGLEPFAMTTGSRGLHVVAPLRREVDYGDVLNLARAFAARAVEQRPEELTTEFLKEHRDERVFVDVLRNRPAQTAVAPYGVRAKPGAPVATPLAWEEVQGLSGPRAFTLRTIGARLQERGDPWSEISSAAASPRAAARRTGASG